MHFRYTDRYGNFAVPVKMVLLMIMIIGVFPVYLVGILACFVACVRQLNTIFVFL